MTERERREGWLAPRWAPPASAHPARGGRACGKWERDEPPERCLGTSERAVDRERYTNYCSISITLEFAGRITPRFTKSYIVKLTVSPACCYSGEKGLNPFRGEESLKQREETMKNPDQHSAFSKHFKNLCRVAPAIVGTALLLSGTVAWAQNARRASP